MSEHRRTFTHFFPKPHDIELWGDSRTESLLTSILTCAPAVRWLIILYLFTELFQALNVEEGLGHDLQEVEDNAAQQLRNLRRSECEEYGGLNDLPVYVHLCLKQRFPVTYPSTSRCPRHM